MSQLISRDGILCDLCCMQYRSHFTYKSFDFRHVSVRNDVRRPPSAICLSADVCDVCWDKMVECVTLHYRPVYRGVGCDITGLIMSGTYDYYVCDVSGVAVSFSNGKASTNVSSNLAELVFSVPAFQQFNDTVLSNRGRVSEWSTSSA